uniref:(California timema) hypothetical protein n=1 Tax=Timema californicum TaxID=61474 RepID=A0A7R9JHS4_TIMCA|nr:unnamed protein product [Timema californicum]
MEIATDTLTMELSPSLSSVTNSLDIPIEPLPSDSGVYNSSQQVGEVSGAQAATVSEDALLMDKYSSAVTNESDMPSEELEKELLEEIDRTKTDENEDSSSNILEDDFLEDRAGESLGGDKENDLEETPNIVADEENQDAPDEVARGETQKTRDDVMEEENQETLENAIEDENQEAPDNGLEKENTQFDGEDKHGSPKCFSPTKINDLEESNNIEDSEGVETSSNFDTRENEESPIIDSLENMDDSANKDAPDNIEESSKNEDIKEIEESSNGESTENVKDSSSIEVSGDDKIPHIKGSSENCEEATTEQTEVNVVDKLEESNLRVKSLELTKNADTNSEEDGQEETDGDAVEQDLQTSDTRNKNLNDETPNKEDSSTNVTLIEDSTNSNPGDAQGIQEQDTEDSLLKDKDDGNLPDVEMAPHLEEEESMEVEEVEDDPFGGSGDKSAEGDETLEVGENSEEKKTVDDEEKADDCEQNEKEKEVDKENTPVAQVLEEEEESKEGNEMEVDDDGISAADTNKEGGEADTIVAENSINVDKNDAEKESTEESATNEASMGGEANTELTCVDESGSTDLEANKDAGDAGKEDDEEICIIPDDLPRVMGSGNKDSLTTTAKTNAAVVNEPIKLTLAKKVSGTRSSVNHNDGAEPSTSVIKRTPSRPQRQAAKKAESQIKVSL